MDMMRRKDRQQDTEFARSVIRTAEYGVLSLVDHDNTPYAIPVSPALVGDTVYIHGATEGKKLAVIANNNKVCLVCVGKTQLLPGEFSTEYESTIAYGTAEIVEDEGEKTEALLAIARKYSPQYKDEAVAYIGRALHQTAVVRITIEEMTAKAKLPKKRPLT
jgi:nitroimidazol reductase NimA-like FMN-containing flavoprotein (pyridoxamine 5'-phosphate oxidase superfamily)